MAQLSRGRRRPPPDNRWGPSREVRLLLRLSEGADALALVLVGRRVALRPAAVLALVLGGQDDVLGERVPRVVEVDRVDDTVTLHAGAEREAERLDDGVRERGAPLVQGAVVGAAGAPRVAG